jgi:hypothetical protein
MTSEYVLNTLDECVGEQRARFMNEMSEEERHEFVEALQVRYIEECMGIDELLAHIPEAEPYLRKAQEACIKTVADFQTAERCDEEGYAGPGGYVNDQGTIWPEDCYSEEPCTCCDVGCVFDADAPNGSADGMCLQCGTKLRWDNDLGEWRDADAEVPQGGPAVPKGYTIKGYDACSESSGPVMFPLRLAVEDWLENRADRQLTAFASNGEHSIASVWDEWRDGWGWSPWEKLWYSAEAKTAERKEMASKAQITKGLEEIGAAWAVRDDKYVAAEDHRDGVSRPMYHIHPDRGYPHVNSIMRFRTLAEIAEYIEVRKLAASLDDGTEQGRNAAMAVMEEWQSNF